jgi:hypothetical protein
MLIAFNVGIADLADPLLFIDRLNDRPQAFWLLPMLAAKGHISIGFANPSPLAGCCEFAFCNIQQ